MRLCIVLGGKGKHTEEFFCELMELLGFLKV
jgi:hypothetical protein